MKLHSHRVRAALVYQAPDIGGGGSTVKDGNFTLYIFGSVLSGFSRTLLQLYIINLHVLVV